jgi:hypothetical protein
MVVRRGDTVPTAKKPPQLWQKRSICSALLIRFVDRSRLAIVDPSGVKTLEMAL